MPSKVTRKPAGDYQVLTSEDQREHLQNEARALESQLFAARGDVGKHEDLLAAVERGEFAAWDRRMVQQKTTEWKNTIQNALIEIHKGEIALANVRGRLDALGAPAPAEGG